MKKRTTAAVATALLASLAGCGGSGATNPALADEVASDPDTALFSGNSADAEEDAMTADRLDRLSTHPASDEVHH